MSGACTVTPGYIFPNGGKLTEAILRQIAAPAVTVAANSIGENEIIASELQSALGIDSARANILVNGLFHDSRWVDLGGVDAEVGDYQTNAQGWWVNPTGATVTYGAEVRHADDAVNAFMALKVTGDSGVTAVQLGQDVPMSSSGRLSDKLQFSAWIYNNTGDSFVPTLIVSTPSAANDFTTCAVMLSQELQTCNNQAWTQVSAQFDPATFTGLEYGMRVAVEIPSGTLTASGKTVSLACVKLEVGETITSIAYDPGTDLGAKSVTLATLSDDVAKRVAKAWVNFNGSFTENESKAFARSGTAVTVTSSAHGLQVDNIVVISDGSDAGLNGWATITAVTSDTFTFKTSSAGTASGTLTWTLVIRGAVNVSSISKNDTGDYTITFETALNNANYAWSSGLKDNGSDNLTVRVESISWVTASSLRVRIRTNNDGDLFDTDYVSIIVFGD
ncbi:MAG: hypothetical protein ACFUZC_05015 [Chthoniobacteraceae bacterium]